MAYSGSVDLISGIRPKNGGSFPLVNAADVYVDDETRLDRALTRTVQIRWSDLKSARDYGVLIPGCHYRIVDYVATTNGNMDSRSASHQFDIIVVADSNDTLNASARAARHSGDSYFPAGTRFCDWRLLYSLDNAVSRFAWAVGDSETDAQTGTGGRGVVYGLVDEWGNSCPYDFKGIQFHAHGDSDSVWRYTFDSGAPDGNADCSISGAQSSVYSNVVLPFISDGAAHLNRIVFEGASCHMNTFGGGCCDCTFGVGCSCNTFGCSCRGILFRSGDSAKSYVSHVTVEGGNINITLDLRGASSASAPYRNVTVKSGVNSAAQVKTIRDDTDGGQSFHTVFKPANSREVEV